MGTNYSSCLSSAQIIWEGSASRRSTLLCPCNSQLVSSTLSSWDLSWCSFDLKHASAFLDQGKSFSDIACKAPGISSNSRVKRNQHYLQILNQTLLPPADSNMIPYSKFKSRLCSHPSSSPKSFTSFFLLCCEWWSLPFSMKLLPWTEDA